MRLGEIRKAIAGTVNTDNHLLLVADALYGDQAYQVHNYASVMQAIKLLSAQRWNDADAGVVEGLRSRYGDTSEAVQMSHEDFNQLQGYLSSLNTKLPIYLGIVESMVQDQDEHALNIRLPNAIHDLAGLTKLNNRLDKLFKEFSIDGGVRFVGFDKGSDWYVLVVVGIQTYHVIIGALKIAQEFFKTTEVYFKSKEAELSYRSALDVHGKDFKDAEFKAYKEKYADLILEEQINAVVDAVKNRNGRSKEELHSHLVKATKDLVKELGEGVEFHLSLNPPSYVDETQGSLTIDYVRVRELNKAAVPEQKQIKSPKSK